MPFLTFYGFSRFLSYFVYHCVSISRLSKLKPFRYFFSLVSRCGLFLPCRSHHSIISKAFFSLLPVSINIVHAIFLQCFLLPPLSSFVYHVFFVMLIV